MGTPPDSSSPLHSNLLAIFTMGYAAPIVGAQNQITANSALNGTFTPAFALRRRGNPLAAAHGIAPSDLKSVRFVPIASNTYIDFKGNRQRRRLGHVRPQRSHHGLDRLVRHFQDQFVMHLHDELSRYPRALQPGVDLDHGALDDVGGRALHGRIDSTALGILPQRLVARLNLRQIQASPENRFNEAAFTRLTARLFHVALHSRITLEVEIHVLLRVAPAYSELAGEPECRHPIHP